MTFEKRQDLIGTILDFKTEGVVPKASQLDDIIDGLLDAFYWTPVTEDLPEEDGMYIVTIEDGKETIVNARIFFNGRWSSSYGITAWMPFPEPYRGEQKWA